MPKILIAYASHEGQTAKIAHEIAGALRCNGFDVTAARVQDAPEPSTFDAVVVGSPIHLGKHDRAVVDWVKRHRAAVQNTHGAFYSVSLAAASSDPAERAEARRLADAFVAETGWSPDQVACFAGALAYSRYGLVEGWMMRRIARKEGGGTDPSHDYEYTDWQSVMDFARQVAASVAPVETPVPV